MNAWIFAVSPSASQVKPNSIGGASSKGTITVSGRPW
jgi:hypothetical protein